MKRRELNALCKSTCHLLLSRNNDINGYWGIGVLCRLMVGSGRWETAFRINARGVVRIFGCELTNSEDWTATLFILGVESVDGRLVFLQDGRYGNERYRYLASIALCMRQGNRVGMAVSHGHCWAHDPSQEFRRAYRPSQVIDHAPKNAKPF